MPRRVEHEVPGEAEILSYDNVPVEVACRFLRMSPPTLYYALQDQRTPFGFAVRSPKGQWTYHISPGQLVKYKRGELPFYRLNEVVQMAAEGVEHVLDEKTRGLEQMLRAVDQKYGITT